MEAAHSSCTRAEKAASDAEHTVKKGRGATRWQQRVRNVSSGQPPGEKGLQPSILLCIFNEICEENESLTCQLQMPQHMGRCRTAIFLCLLNRRQLTSHPLHPGAVGLKVTGYHC